MVNTASKYAPTRTGFSYVLNYVLKEKSNKQKTTALDVRRLCSGNYPCHQPLISLFEMLASDRLELLPVTI